MVTKDIPIEHVEVDGLPHALIIRREVIESDADQIEQLVRETGFFEEHEVLVARELVDDRLSAGPTSGYEFLILEQDSQVVAYTCFGLIACTKHAFDLYWIAVRPSHQRLGLGRWLAQQTEKTILAQGGLSIYIETSGREQYLSTRKYYERCGYSIVAEFPDFYDLGDPKIVYSKRLSGITALSATDH